MQPRVVLFTDEPHGEEWRNAFIEAYRGRLSPSRANEVNYIQSIIPEQSKRVFLFERRDGKVTIAADLPPSSQEFTEDQLEIYNELQADAKVLISSCQPHSNRYLRRGSALSAYLDALGPSIRQFRRSELWHAGRRLRRLQIADERRLSERDIEDPAYDPDQGAALELLVILHNIFCSLDPKLADLDGRGSDPALKIAGQSLDATRKLIEISAARTDLFEKAVPKVLTSLIEESQIGGTVGRRAAEIGVDSARNVVVLLLHESVSEILFGDSGWFK